MVKTLILATILALAPTYTQAQTQRVVMSISDSRGGTGGSSNFPTLLDQARTDFIICNKYVNGDTSWNVLNRLTNDFNACSQLGTVTDVLILVGVADALWPGPPEDLATYETATRIRTIAETVRNLGAREWILTEPPAPIVWGGVITANSRTNKTEDWLRHLNGTGTVYNIIDVRNLFTETYWYVPTCSSDGLHPTGLACRQLIANLIKTILP